MDVKKYCGWHDIDSIKAQNTKEGSRIFRLNFVEIGKERLNMEECEYWSCNNNAEYSVEIYYVGGK